MELAQDNPKELDKLYKQIDNESLDYLKELIDHGHKNGLEIPEKLKDYLKSTPLSKQIDLDNRMSAREKAKARQKA